MNVKDSSLLGFSAPSSGASRFVGGTKQILWVNLKSNNVWPSVFCPEGVALW